MSHGKADRREMILLGTGTSTGVPVIGCDCAVCRSTDPRNNRTRSGVAVTTPRGTLLIDTPPELRIQLLRENIGVANAVLFTHSHADHIFGLDDLRIFGHYLDGPVPVYCESAVEEQLRRAFHYAFVKPAAHLHRGAVPQLECHPIATDPFELLGITVRPIRLLHGRLPVLGFRFENVAFCTDVSEIPDESWPLLEGLDTLVIDALRDRPHATHFNIEQSLAVVERVKPRQTFFTHLSHELDHATTSDRLPAGVALGYDGLRIPF